MSTYFGEILSCYSCGISFGVPSDWYQNRRNDHEWFYCPNGHKQHFLEESEAEKLRRERDRLKQQMAQRDDEIRDKDRQLISAKGQMTKLRNRIGAGVCPCCTRTFTNLARHMKTKHPSETKLQCVAS